jgi:hypothetical protein
MNLGKAAAFQVGSATALASAICRSWSPPPQRSWIPDQDLSGLVHHEHRGQTVFRWSKEQGIPFRRDRLQFGFDVTLGRHEMFQATKVPERGCTRSRMAIKNIPSDGWTSTVQASCDGILRPVCPGSMISLTRCVAIGLPALLRLRCSRFDQRETFTVRGCHSTF